MADGIKLIVGLGNPGAEYANTRHNVGAWFVQRFAETAQLSLRLDTKLSGSLAKVTMNDQSFYLFIPSTFMNDSGQAVAAASRFYKIQPNEILVAHDELDFPPGKVRIKENGGHGGHNGLRDIIQYLSTQDFYRLRIGIGHPGHKDHVTPFVLSRPTPSEREKLMISIEEALSIIPDLIAGKFQEAMKQLHGKTDGI